MAPAAAFRAATSDAARLMGVGDERGSIEPGKRADLVVVSGDPLDFATLEDRIQAVYLDGRLAVPAGSARLG
jgi:imidazolonepropionase-like amidohydrolase